MAVNRYAEATSVSADRSRAEIERTLDRYGATAYAYGRQGQAASIMFEIRTPAGVRRVRFLLALPDRQSKDFTLTPTGRARSGSAASEAYDQAVRQRWRALALVIKAKLEAVAAGITTVEEEFLAHVVLPSGDTVGDWVRPQLAVAYERNVMPAILPGGPGDG